jgi:25S rRNA (adenine2142-N1)-methyltransferase
MAKSEKAKKPTRQDEVKQNISKGRPPLASKPKPTISKEAARKTISSVHNINKNLAKAKAKGDDKEVENLKKSLDKVGGIAAYQAASLQGQANDRGGDTSIVLVEWLKDLKPNITASKTKLRMLEIGALSVKNECSKSGMFDITRIDLNSQGKGIEQQDFMERPVPKYEKDKFDIVSCSLVLNFVPLPQDRGEMLKRICLFLDQRAPRSMAKELQANFPALFLVLPVACVNNSHFLNEERLTLIMDSLGFVVLRRKETDKLVYYLWLLRDQPSPEKQKFPKKEIKTGGKHNNFAIVLRP